MIREHTPRGQDFIQVKAQCYRPLKEAEFARSRTTSNVRTQVEYVFVIFKRNSGMDPSAIRACILRDGSSQNCQDAMRDGHAEP